MEDADGCGDGCGSLLIYAFRRSPDGSLALEQVRTDGGPTLAVSPESTHLHAASSAEIRAFRIIR
jgi:hypothetical protein